MPVVRTLYETRSQGAWDIIGATSLHGRGYRWKPTKARQFQEVLVDLHQHQGVRSSGVVELQRMVTYRHLAVQNCKKRFLVDFQL